MAGRSVLETGRLWESRDRLVYGPVERDGRRITGFKRADGSTYVYVVEGWHVVKVEL